MQTSINKPGHKQTNYSQFAEKRMVFFVSSNVVQPVVGAAADTAIKTPLSAGLDFAAGTTAKTLEMGASALDKAVLKQFDWNSFLILPVIGRIRGSIMQVLRQGLDSKASPFMHPVVQTIPNIANNFNNALQRILTGIVHGDGGPSVDVTAAAKESIDQAKESFQTSREKDPRDNSIAFTSIPILGAPHALLGAAKELIIDTHLEAIISGVKGIAERTFGVVKDTFSKMFLSEGKDLNFLQRILKIPTGLLAGASDLVLSKEKSPIVHLIGTTIPNYIRNGMLSIARGVLGIFLGDPGEQVQVGEDAVKAKSLGHRAVTTTTSWLTGAGNWIKGLVGSGGAAGEAVAAAGEAAAAAGEGAAAAAA